MMDPDPFERLRSAAGPLWTEFTGHSFVRGLGDGTLPTPAFQRYLMQDYLFLIQFARAYALAGYKAQGLADLRAAADGCAAILGELPLHVSFCAGWGLDEAGMAAEPEALETVAYTRFVLDCGAAGDLLDLYAALAPCVLGYAEIGPRLAARPVPATRTRRGSPPTPGRTTRRLPARHEARSPGSGPNAEVTHVRRPCRRRSTPQSTWRPRFGAWVGVEQRRLVPADPDRHRLHHPCRGGGCSGPPDQSRGFQPCEWEPNFDPMRDTSLPW